jgi:DNA polymerase III epsilon subunit-like protein
MIVALDLETTGLDNTKDNILEVALVKFDELTFEIIDTYSSLIHPEVEIPSLISNITNIFDKDVVDAPIFETEREKIIDFI